MKNTRVQILGTDINLLVLDQAVQQIEEFIHGKEFHYVCFCNVHTIMTCKDDKTFRRITNDAALALPDGMPLVWTARLYGYHQPRRVYGPDLMLVLSKKGFQRIFSFPLRRIYKCARDPCREIKRQVSRIKIVGCYSPPFRSLSQHEDEKIVRMINESGADILWVGLGAPKQERWMASHCGRIKAPVMLGVGAAFDFHSGTVKQSPKWMQDRGIEWLFRLCVDPKRLWKRYLINNYRFVYHLVKEAIAKRLNLKLQ